LVGLVGVDCSLDAVEIDEDVDDDKVCEVDDDDEALILAMGAFSFSSCS
jgi:hypothetical protein